MESVEREEWNWLIVHTSFRTLDQVEFASSEVYPNRDSISHPFAPVPSTSNVGIDALQSLYYKEPTQGKAGSLLCQYEEKEVKDRRSRRAKSKLPRFPVSTPFCLSRGQIWPR